MVRGLGGRVTSSGLPGAGGAGASTSPKAVRLHSQGTWAERGCRGLCPPGTSPRPAPVLSSDLTGHVPTKSTC